MREVRQQSAGPSQTQPRSQSCIRRVLAQSNDSLILICRQFLYRTLKNRRDANLVSPISSAPPHKNKHRKKFLIGTECLVDLRLYNQP